MSLSFRALLMALQPPVPRRSREAGPDFGTRGPARTGPTVAATTMRRSPAVDRSGRAP